MTSTLQDWPQSHSLAGKIILENQRYWRLSFCISATAIPIYFLPWLPDGMATEIFRPCRSGSGIHCFSDRHFYALHYTHTVGKGKTQGQFSFEGRQIRHVTHSAEGRGQESVLVKSLCYERIGIMSGTDDFVGMKIGAAARANCFDFSSEALDFLKDAIVTRAS